MPHYYFDSSALVKNYVLETGTQFVNPLHCHLSLWCAQTTILMEPLSLRDYWLKTPT